MRISLSTKDLTKILRKEKIISEKYNVEAITRGMGVKPMLHIYVEETPELNNIPEKMEGEDKK